MAARQPVTPDDLRAAAVIVREGLSKVAGAEWEVMPPKMTWTRKATIVHTIGALHLYATQLASGSRERVATFWPDPVRTETRDLPALVVSGAAILARVAEASSPGTRGFHPQGSPDPEGFLAMGCVEVLMHAWDTVNGTAASVTAPDDLSARVVRRLFPWSPADAPGWQALLFETGRGELAGHESPGDVWMWHNPPLDEWDGKVRRSDRWKGR
jgi:hypothetical protein